MSSVVEIEAALRRLSADDLARVETVLQRLRSEGALEVRFDGKPWPATEQERDALIADLDALPPVLGNEDADRFDAWRAAEKERQKGLLEKAEPGRLFS